MNTAKAISSSSITQAVLAKAKSVLAAHQASTRTAVVLANHWKAALAQKIVNNEVTGTPVLTRYVRSSNYGRHVWTMSPSLTTKDGGIMFHGEKASKQLLELFMLDDEDLCAAGEGIANSLGRICMVNGDFGLLLIYPMQKAISTCEATGVTGSLETTFVNVLFGMVETSVIDNGTGSPELHAFIPLSQLKGKNVDLQQLQLQLRAFTQSQ